MNEEEINNLGTKNMKISTFGLRFVPIVKNKKIIEIEIVAIF